MKICFVGDMFFGGDLKGSKLENAIQIDEFHNADLRVINLEQSVSNSSYTAPKGTLYTDSNVINQLKELKVDAVNLAHNHIQDKGIEGISDTVNILNSSGIGTFGAGSNLHEARRPFFISESIVIFGYCDFDKPYLNQIEIASNEKAGINPLRYANILEDLSTLNDDVKAILYFHWGKEHVFLPKHYDIELSKKLLLDDRILLIMGMHPHRLQGFLNYNNKRAYMSLGNFLFPNFYISPPSQLYYPIDNEQIKYITYQYHRVFKNTYKKWKWINRISVVIEYDTETNMTKEILVKQDDNKAKVKKVTGFEFFIANFVITFSSIIIKLPKWVYTTLENTHSNFVNIKWLINIYLFKISQLGLRASLLLLKNKLLNGSK